MVKFNIPYTNRVTYPIKASALLQDVCQQAGLQVGNMNFVNSDYMILGNPFTNNEDCRTVLSNIAQLAGGFAKIGRDDKVYINTLESLSNILTVKYVNAMTVKELNLTKISALAGGKDVATESLDGNNYFTDFSKNDQWGELNSLVLSLSDIQGENTALDDRESIEENGLTEISIVDNYFLIDQTEREKAIVPIWNALKGLKYLPFKTEYYGYPYLDTGDIVYIEDTADMGHISYVFNHTFTYNGSFKGTLETPAMTKMQTAYKNTFDLKTKFKRTERKIDKINGIIEDIIEEQDETSQKVSQHQQTIDGMKNTISSVETKVETVEGKADNAQSDVDALKPQVVLDVDVEYALGTSTTTAPTTGWNTKAPTWENGKYMWQRTVTTYGDNTKETSNATCIAGAKGDKGETGEKGNDGNNGENGDDGIGVKAIVEQYYLSTSNTTQAGGSWKSTQDTWTSGKYIWTRNKITWTDDTITYTTPILATGINNANSTAETAKSTANTAKTTADTAKATADTAKSTADSNTAKITTNTEKIAEVEQTVDGIKTRVSSTETSVRTLQTDVATAQSTADTAKNNAKTAQDTADSATTKANQAQTSANNAQTTANTANTNAQNAQSTADSAITQITTTNQKVSTIEQNVNGITQRVGSVEEEVETVQNKVDNLTIGGRNYIRYGKGTLKDGFFKNANIVDEGGEFEWKNTSSSPWANVNIGSAYTIGQREFTPNNKLIMSYDIKYTLWDIPDGVTIGEHWLGGRYGNPSWKGITQFTTPLVGNNGCELNKWFHFVGTCTVPPLLDDSVPIEIMFRFQFKNGIGHIKAVLKNVKLEVGNKATDWTPAPEDIENTLETNYYTKTETNSQISQKADEITSTVSATYSTKTETATAKTEAINSANASTDSKLEGYSTTEQMNTAITQKANEITSTVSSTYSTKTETATAKSEAISSANSATDTKLENYSTTAQMNTAITQKANSITSEVNTKIDNIQVDTDNLLLNTALRNDASNFTLSSGVTRVTDKLTPNNNYCFKYDISGLTSDGWRSANPTYVEIEEGETITASAYVYIPSGVTNSNIRLEIQAFNSSNSRIETYRSDVPDSDITDKWQRLCKTATLPTGTVKANARVWIQRNGQCWVGDLKLGKGNTLTSWCPSSKDYSTTTETKSLIKQTSDNLDIKFSQEILAVSGANGMINGDFSNNLQYWNVMEGNGSISVTKIGNIDYALLETQYGDTILAQDVFNLYENKSYILTFRAYSPYLTEDVTTFRVRITQYKTGSEEETLLINKKIELTDNPKEYTLNFSTTDATNLTINFILNANQNLGYENDTAYISNIQLKGETISEKIAKLSVNVNGIESEVSGKVGNNEIISKINQSSETVGIDANKIELSANDILNLLSGNTINLSGKNIRISSNNFNVDASGNVSANSMYISNGNLIIYRDGNVWIRDTQDYDNAHFRAISKNQDMISRLTSNGFFTQNDSSGQMSQMTPDSVTTPVVNQISLASSKKNFEKLKNALEIIRNTDIYKYNLKSQADNEKKHIGFVIGDKYRYAKEITALNERGEEIAVDTYSMISVTYKAIQELLEENEKLIERIEKLEKGDSLGVQQQT